MNERPHLTTRDTIAAIATPPGRGGVGIVRVSGPLVKSITQAALGYVPPARYAEYLPFLDADGVSIDNGIALFFPAPHSFTGEDVLELQGHGGPVVLDLLLQRIVALGARLARPGEFSERAFLNDKIDLAQAEAIADLIDAASEQAARSALRSLQGEFSAAVHVLVEQLIQLRMYVEAAIDFPEEEIDFLSDKRVSGELNAITAQLEKLTTAARQGCLLQEGINVVIAGQPNAGKSSLLNRLAQRESAIVTEVPGTTRDVLRERIAIDGLPLHIIDTAGLRRSDDPIERIGILRAWEEIARADRVLLVIDDRHGITADDREIIAQLPRGLMVTVVRNKIDLTGGRSSIAEGELGSEIALSAKTGEGVDLLCRHLAECVGYERGCEGVFIARRRHLDALERARDFLASGRNQLTTAQAGELLAEDLRQAQQALGDITGEITSDDLLGRIFTSFCIGK